MNILFTKVSKRLRKSLVRIIPYNLSYKPKGIYKNIESFIKAGVDKEAKYIELYPEYISNTHIPQEYLDQCVKDLELPAIATIPASKLVAVPNGRLYSDGVENVSIITSDNKILGEVTYQNKPSNIIEENVLLKQNYFIAPQHYKGVVFHLLIGGSGNTNYFHWLIDSLSRIHLLKESGWFEKVDWFLVPGHRVDYQKDSLRMLGINEGKIIVGSNETHIKADILLATTYVRYSEHVPLWCCNFLRNHFLKLVSSNDSQTHPYVYISRKDANRRRIVNESELLILLEKYGFKSYELTSLPFHEKIQLFYNAKVIIATHGAGQANLVFCKSGTTVLELSPEGFIYPMFYDISNKMNLIFDYLVLKLDAKAKTMSQLIRADMVADISQIEKKLNKIMTKHRRENVMISTNV